MALGQARTVGDLVAEVLSHQGVDTVFGMISVHNLPMMDGLARKKTIHMVMTRGETGAAHMADGYARASGRLGVVISSTGPGASNTVPGLVEARFACTPLLHVTGQTVTAYLDRNLGPVHDMPDQLGMLKAVCKAAFRVRAPEEALSILRQAIHLATSAPAGPVSVEIPIDIQRMPVPRPYAPHDFDVTAAPPVAPSEVDLDRLARRVLQARRPMLRVGRGALAAGREVQALLDMGFGLITSWGGRGVVSESHPQNLASLNGVGVPMVEDFYRTVDLMLVAGSGTRNAETLDRKIRMPEPQIQIDIEYQADGRTYPTQDFIHGDCRLVLAELVERIRGSMSVDPAYPAEIGRLKQEARAVFEASLGPYASFPTQLRDAMPDDAIFARDITLSNSTWGYRLFPLNAGQGNIYPVSSGLGQGVQLAIGAARGAKGRKTVCLTGDGGFFFNLAELWTAVQESLDIVFIVMNDGGYGVIKHMQAAMFEGRHRFVDLAGPELQGLGELAGMLTWKVQQADAFGDAVGAALAVHGPTLVEVDMAAVGAFPPYYPHSEMIARQQSAAAGR